MHIQESNFTIKYTQNMDNYQYGLYLPADNHTVNASADIPSVYHIITNGLKTVEYYR